MTISTTIAVVGLGYVGLPLAVEFGKQYTTIGFDLSEAKIDAYRRGVDPTGEVSGAELAAATGLEVTTDPAQLKRADFIVVAVPTPVDDAHQPDFGAVARRERIGRQDLQARRDRRVRIDGLSGRDRGDLRPDHRAPFGHEVAATISSSAIRPERINPATGSTR